MEVIKSRLSRGSLNDKVLREGTRLCLEFFTFLEILCFGFNNLLKVLSVSIFKTFPNNFETNWVYPETRTPIF